MVRQLRLAQPDQRHFRSHQCPIDRVEAQQRESGVIARALQIDADEAPCQPRQTVIREVHEREGHVADHIDAAQLAIELDGVEYDGPALP